MHLLCDAWRRNLFERFENQTVQSKSKRDRISGLNKSLRKVGVKNDIVYVETSDANLLY